MGGVGRQRTHFGWVAAPNEAFDVSTIGVQYRNFAAFEKTGGSIWTLTGTPDPGAATPWTITQGTLAISASDNLGTAGETLTFNGGTLQLASGFFGPFNHPIVLQAGGGTLDTANNNLVLTTAITGRAD